MKTSQLIKRSLKSALLGSLLLVTTISSAQNSLSLNGNWKFKLYPEAVKTTDSSFYHNDFITNNWQEISVPSNWEMKGFAEPVYGKTKQDGTGLYKRSFELPVNWNNSQVYVTFDGVLFAYTVWINGQKAGEFSSGFNRKQFDITPFIRPGKTNEIAVKVIRLPKGWEFDTFDCWSLAGIYRDVTLSAKPQIHISDCIVNTTISQNAATIRLNTIIFNAKKVKIPSGTTLAAKLIDNNGRIAGESVLENIRIDKKQTDSNLLQQINVSNPALWNAENPNLYTLQLTLSNHGKVLHQYSEKIGIREISWTNGVLKLNGQAIKLRGIDHHDLSPVNGRAVTEAEMLTDLKLIREANINFIRTSHYPPTPRFLALCDSLGFYVMDEVPFGFGDNHLNDTTYLPLLQLRARATIARDKNHPCVLVWSVGNENPLTKMCVKVGEYVHELDPTRPHCYPQIGSYFQKIQETIPASVDILSPHYTAPSTLRGYSNKFDRPMIVTEYAHSLGLDFDKMEALWEIMVASPKLAGGAVWHLFDQGLLRKSPVKTTPGAFTYSAWKDSVMVYDNNGNQGADGIVYANRIPQVDYWQVRKVYTPVKALDDTLRIGTGKQQIKIRLINRYDFTDLSANNCKWTLYADTSIIQSGTEQLACAPHDTMSLSINLNLPQQPAASYYYLKLQFSNQQVYTFYEKVYPIQLSNHQPELLKQLYVQKSKPVLTDNRIRFGENTLTVNKQNGAIQLETKSGKKLILDGPFARMGRKTTMSELATTSRTIEEAGTVKQAIADDPLLAEKAKADKHQLWNPYLLKNPTTKIKTWNANKLVINYTYERKGFKDQTVSGDVEYSVSDSGRMDVHYKFEALNTTGTALETGLSFLLPESLTEFRWVGKGPYPAYPGKDRLDEFGCYHLNSADLNFQGNRQQVDMATITDKTGFGLAFVANQANIAIEHGTDGLIVSHNAAVSGRFNKGGMPEKKIDLSKNNVIEGTFSIIPLSSEWPLVLKKLFGQPTKTVTPFVPFYNSYDQ